MKRVVLFAVCGALIIPAAAAAQAPAPQPAAPAAKPAKDKRVCKATEETGSRLGRKTICRTQAEWDEISFRQRMELERKSRLSAASPTG